MHNTFENDEVAVNCQLCLSLKLTVEVVDITWSTTTISLCPYVVFLSINNLKLPYMGSNIGKVRGIVKASFH